MVDFPAELSPYSIDQTSYTEGFANVMIRSEQEMGRPKRRRRFTAAIKILKFTFMFSGDELDTFIDWFENDIAGGATSFGLPHPRTGAYITVAFKKEPEPASKRGQDLYAVPVELDIIP